MSRVIDMPKTRTIGRLLDLYEEALTKARSVDSRMETIRRFFYPKATNTLSINRRQGEVRRSCFLPKTARRENRCFCVTSFTHYNEGDSWSFDFYEGLSDTRLWERAHYGVPYPVSEIEKLAWEAGESLIYSGYDPETEHLVREHFDLYNYSRNVWNRSYVIKQAMEIGILNSINPNVQSYRNYYPHRNGKVVDRTRVFIGDRAIVTIENGSLLVEDLYKERTVSEQDTVPYGDFQCEGSNYKIKTRLREKRERLKKEAERN